MEHKPIKLFGLFVALILVMACSLAGGDATQVPVETAALEEATQSDATEEPLEPTVSSENNVSDAQIGPCANIYYPVRKGATWNYQSTSTIADDYLFTDTITSVRDDGYTLTTEFEGLTRTQEWSCTPEGLVALQLGGGLSTSGSNLVVETQNASGVTYPAEMNAGDIWQYKLDFTGTMDLSGQTGEATGNTQSDFTALGTESVTIPAGTFDAMKVQVNTTLDINVSFQGVIVPVIFTSKTTTWYAEDVGWVKSVSEANFAGEAFTETIELQWYNIP